MIKLYKNCVIRFFNKPPKLVRAKKSFIDDLVAKDSNTLMVAFYETEEMAKNMVKLAAKSWGGQYSVI